MPFATETDVVVVNSGVDPWNGVDISMSNGFRFGNAVLPDSDITLRDLYTWFPVGPAVNVGEFAGQAIEASLEEILAAVFNRNPFLQRGGWYLGLANMTQEIDLDNRPFSSSSGRIVETQIGGAPLDTSKRYVFASCYAHGDAIDRVCRTRRWFGAPLLRTGRCDGLHQRDQYRRPGRIRRPRSRPAAR